nr:Crp/Fnr family transcriptional regulator [bacterium]
MAAQSMLFDGIQPHEYEAMLSCFQATCLHFSPGEEIVSYGSGLRRIGIVQSGQASLRRIDLDGNSTLMETLGPDSVFGEVISFSDAMGDDFSVVCEQACEVLFIDYDHIIKRCPRACAHHSQLVRNMLRLISEKAARLSQRVEVLSYRTIRDRLMCYFHLLAAHGGGRSFELPFSLTALAEYLCVDRTAMMREIRHLKQEGAISLQGRRVTLSHLA